jgi:excisionase family DNA binding protein
VSEKNRPPLKPEVRGTVQDAADYYKVSTKTIRRYIVQGLISAERVGPRLIRVDMSSLEDLGRSLLHVDGDV